MNSTANMEDKTNLWKGIKAFSDTAKITSWVIHYDPTVSMDTY